MEILTVLGHRNTILWAVETKIGLRLFFPEAESMSLGGGGGGPTSCILMTYVVFPRVDWTLH